MKKHILSLSAALILAACSSHPHGYGSGEMAGAVLFGIFTSDPNALTREDRAIMAREAAEQEAAERAAKKASAP